MNLLTQHSLSTAFILASFPAFAGPFVHAPHSVQEYNQRFIENALAPTMVPGKTFHVSADSGNDANRGTVDKPFKTLEAARDAIREVKKLQGLPPDGIQVSIGPGNYLMQSPLKLVAEDSGTLESPVVWKGVDRDRVIISGGTSLDVTELRPAQESTAQGRFHPKARGKLVVHNLTNVDILRLFGKQKLYRQISMDGHLLQLAQWPNRGYHHIGKIFDEGPKTRWMKPGEKPPPYNETNPSGAKFSFEEPLPPAVTEEFQRTRDMRLEGYFHNDWYFQNERVGRIDGTVIQLLRHTRYGVANHIEGMARRVRLVNVLAELDEPGEWYLDRQLKQLFIWPIRGFSPKKSTLTIPGGPPLLSMNNTSYVTFRDVIFENTGSLAASVTGGQNNLIANIVIRNGNGRGLAIDGGKHNGITGCEFYDLHHAFNISGGDVRALERCYNFATNNEIHNCRRRGYGMIHLQGVGIYFAHNLLHDMNGAVSFNTVDLLMEYNEFYNIGYEMGDFNVAYCGAKWHTMNNVIRYNFVHHLIEPGGHPISPFRNDDGGAGLKIYGNVFYRTGRCAGQFHGPVNDLQNNIALGVPIFWWTLKKPIRPTEIEEAWEHLSRFGRDLPKGSKEDYLFNLERTLGKRGWQQSPWKEQFPEIAEFIRENPWAQSFCNVNVNYTHNVPKAFHIHGASGSVKGMESRESGGFEELPKNGIFELPSPVGLDAFTDVESLDFRFKESFQPMENFKPIPFEKIGLHSSPFRSHNPDKATYRSAVYQKFKNDSRRRYDPKTANARYPKPAYLN